MTATLARPWTDAEIAACSLRWRRGESATAIAQALNRTRNSVVAKMHRLRVPTPKSPFPDGLPRYDYESTHRSGRNKRNARQRAERIAQGKIPRRRMPRSLPPQKRLIVIPDNCGFVRPQPWHPVRDAKPEWLRRRAAAQP